MTGEEETLRREIAGMQQTQAGLESDIVALNSQFDQVRRALHIAKLGVGSGVRHDLVLAGVDRSIGPLGREPVLA